MKVMTTWSLNGDLREAAVKFLTTGAAPQPGVTLLGRWHSVDLAQGFSLYETDNPAALYAGAAEWKDFLDLQTFVVVEDAEAGAALAKIYG